MEILGRWGKNNIQKFWNAAFQGFHIRRYDVVLHVTKSEAKLFFIKLTGKFWAPQS